MATFHLQQKNNVLNQLGVLFDLIFCSLSAVILSLCLIQFFLLRMCTLLHLTGCHTIFYCLGLRISYSYVINFFNDSPKYNRKRARSLLLAHFFLVGLLCSDLSTVFKQNKAHKKFKITHSLCDYDEFKHLRSKSKELIINATKTMLLILMGAFYLMLNNSGSFNGSIYESESFKLTTI